MAIQLVTPPKVKITLLSDEELDSAYPGYVLENFNMTKRLLEPNKFEFTLCRDNSRIVLEDYDFVLKDELLGARVECSVKAKRYDVNDEQWVEYDVEDFFYGYVQNIKVVRTSNTAPYRLRCVAYSPDARMKGHPSCATFKDENLKTCVEEVLCNAVEWTVPFDGTTGKYGNKAEGILSIVEPLTGDFDTIPYTVQYNESAYDFLKRLAVRYAEFMYYENKQFVFGDIPAPELITMHLGTDLEEYTYELNMNDHTGVVFAEHHPNLKRSYGIGMQKEGQYNNTDEPYKSVVYEEEYSNDWAYSAFKMSEAFFGNFDNTITELGSTPNIGLDAETENRYTASVRSSGTNITNMNNTDAMARTHAYDQRYNLDLYVMSDSLLCYGKSARCDLKLGSIIAIEEETRTGKHSRNDEDWIEHETLKVIDLTYQWPIDNKHYLAMGNTFKAMQGDATVPPYLERDKNGFLVYGDNFDVYPKSGPQYGIVVDNKDPEHLGRVQVALTWQQMAGRCQEGSNYDPVDDDRNRTPWIWVMNPYQGYNHGALLVPEIGDQVLVGYEHNNVERPYVMGSRFSTLDSLTPRNDWEKNNKNNNIKGFRTRRGHTIEIVDAESPDTGHIRIYDRYNMNYDIMIDSDQSLIRIETPGNIELVAGGNIVMDAKGDINMRAKGNLEVKTEGDIAMLGNRAALGSEEYTRIQSDKKVEVDSNGYVDIGWKEGSDHSLDIINGLYVNNEGTDVYCRSDVEHYKNAVLLNDNGVEMRISGGGKPCGVAVCEDGTVMLRSDKAGIEMKARTLTSKTDGETKLNGSPIHIN